MTAQLVATYALGGAGALLALGWSLKPVGGFLRDLGLFFESFCNGKSMLDASDLERRKFEAEQHERALRRDVAKCHDAA